MGTLPGVRASDREGGATVSWIIPVTVIVVFVVLVIDDVVEGVWQGGATSSYDMVELMRRDRGRHE